MTSLRFTRSEDGLLIGLCASEEERRGADRIVEVGKMACEKRCMM